MVNLTREGLVRLLFSLSRSVFKSEDSTEVSEEPQALASVNAEVEPMKAYWESEKQIFNAKNQPFLDLFPKGAGLERIPDVTEEPTKESHYNYNNFSPYLPEAVKHFNVQGVPETPKTDPGISNNGRDAGVIAGIVVAVISGVIILAALIAVVMYRHYVHRNVTSMNFDNPVYRKTTEDQFALEKNGYAPGSKLYPSTVGEEAQEPLNTPGTNEFV